MDSAGFVFYPEKSALETSQINTFEGFFLNSVRITVCLTPPKEALKRRPAAEAVYQANFVTIWELVELVGILVECFQCVEYGKLFYTIMDNEKTAAIKRHSGDYRCSVKLSMEAKLYLLWWIDNIESATKHVTRCNSWIILESDASKLGCKRMSWEPHLSVDYGLRLNEDVTLIRKCSAPCWRLLIHSVQMLLVCNIQLLSDNATAVR